MKTPGYIFVISALFITFSSCGEDQRETQQAFLQNFDSYCGYAYEGYTEYIDLGEDHQLDGAELLMILDHCEENEVRIPFWVNDDRSRTWILSIDDRGLRLSHDHRYENGTEHEANMYGGYSDDRATNTKHFYPADEQTIEDRPQRDINTWSTEIDRENDRYIYRLYLEDELRYEAIFDLSEPIALDDVQ